MSIFSPFLFFKYHHELVDVFKSNISLNYSDDYFFTEIYSTCHKIHSFTRYSSAF